MNRYIYSIVLLLAWAFNVQAQTPTFVQHCGTGPQSSADINNGPHPGVGGDPLTDYIMQCPGHLGNGNTVLVAISHDDSSAATESVSDGTNTYTLVVRVHDTTKGQFGSLFEAHNLSGSPNQITVSFSTTTVIIWGLATEFRNIATTSPVDVSGGNFGASTSITSGSITPTQTGDLLYQVMFVDGSASLPLTGFTVGSQSNITWKFIATDKVFGLAAQYGVYSSTAAINPTFTVAPSTNFISITVALKAASAGTAPTGMYVSSVHHNNTTNETAASAAFFWPPDATGSVNLRVIEFISSASRTISSCSDGTNTYTKAGAGANNDSDVEIWYVAAPTVSSLLTTTCNISGTNAGGHGDTFMAYDVVGAASSPLDTTSGTTGNNLSGNITGMSLTPGAGSGIIFSAIGIAQDTVTGITTTGSQFITIRSTGEHEPTTQDENNGWAVHPYSSTATVTDVWTHDTGDQTGAGQWAAFGASFKASVTTLPPNQFPRVIGQ